MVRMKPVVRPECWNDGTTIVFCSPTTKIPFGGPSFQWLHLDARGLRGPGERLDHVSIHIEHIGLKPTGEFLGCFMQREGGPDFRRADELNSLGVALQINRGNGELILTDPAPGAMGRAG